ncbi:hypothetical protein [Virgibacillus oceani]|uniref:Uncharacterized protein n=1 Tax=Virgibacillus oceani TaxID=1479511 RepID=A0A917H086_9BACI|nr:hypothetical protein [Virgibacillus oceani]GGG63243.1 hypothetical protein GCM10011398_03320 [Virgibacillus oceani]
MVRSFIILLLLAVFFLTGMLLGIDRGQNADGSSSGSENKIEEIVVKTPKEVTTIENNEASLEKVSDQTISAESSPQFTQKMASILETGIKWFYDMVVLIVYQIAELFF